MGKIKLSIIVPVYNVEKYVGDTLRSIMRQRQDLFDYEIIVVNDGTPDQSMKVVESFIDKLPLTIINQKNKGLSCARNTGLRQSNGDYVWFVDSDDTLTTDAFDTFWDIVQNYDAEIYTFSLLAVHEGEGDVKPMKTIYTKHPERYYGKVFSGHELHRVVGTGIVPKNIFKRSFLYGYKLSFYEGVLHEDLEFLVRAFFLAKKVYVSDKAIYVYLLRSSGSITSSLSEKNLESELSILDSFDSFKQQYAKTAREKAIINDNIFFECSKLISLDDSVVNGYSTFMASYSSRIRRKGIRAGLSSLFYISTGKFLKILMLILCPKLLKLARPKVSR